MKILLDKGACLSYIDSRGEKNMNKWTSFDKWIKKTGRKIPPCNCGGYGVDHAPDCAKVMGLNDAWQDFEEEKEEAEEERT
jgi:hypothetical protein